METVIYTNLVPGVGGDVRAYLNSFLRNTGQLGTIGVVALGLSALLLLSTIEATFNRIWRVERPRPILVRFLMYWGVLTLGPLLIGAGITLTSDVFSVARQGLSQAGLDADQLAMAAGGLGDQLISVLLQTGLFTILFAVVPNRRIAWGEALIGGFVSGAGFQILKIGFAAYLANAITYQTIYGALAVFPIFLIWLYLSWVRCAPGGDVRGVVSGMAACRFPGDGYGTSRRANLGGGGSNTRGSEAGLAGWRRG